MDQRNTDMTDSDAADEANCSTNVNKPINLDDTEFQCHDEYSQDLFDDTENSVENSPCINFDTSQITTVNSPRFTDFTSLTQTPKIGKEESSPCHPTIPTIPKSLIPFISTVNESWNSDLETPQAKTAAEMNLQRSERIEQLSKSCETIERKGVIPDVTTPSGCFVARVENEEISSSPILNTMIKRRRPKRRILKSFIDNKEATNVCQTYADVHATTEIENFESLTQNDTTFVIDENRSLHNSNIHLVKDEINDSIQDSTLIGNNEECLMNKRLQGCEESEEINANEVVMDYADVEYSMNKTAEKTLAELVEEIEELEENKEQIVEHKYVDIPIDVFTRDAKALENAKMIPTKPLNISSVKKQRGLISFTEMCLLEQDNSENEDSGIKEIKKTNSPIKNFEFSQNLQEDKLTTGQSDALSSKRDEDTVDIFSSSFSERDESVIDIDEFSPWFYQSNETKSEFLNNIEKLTTEYAEGKITASEIATRQKNGLGKEKELAFKSDKLIDCSSSYTTSKGKTKLCLDETAKDGKINHVKTSPKGSASSNHQVGNKENMWTDSIQFHSSIGFSTASGKPITISEEKIKKAAKLYDEIALQDGTHYDAEMSHDKTGDLRKNNNENERAIFMNSHSSVGFCTAGGKPIKISESKLEKAAKLYEEIALQDQKQYNAKILQEVPENQRMKNEENEATIHQNSHCSLGFSTASGKPIKISKDKLQEALKSYEAIALQDTEQFDAKVLDRVAEDHKAERKDNEATTVKNSYCSVGFSTASGKPIKISEDKLKEAEKLYNEISLTDNSQLPDPLKVPIPRGLKRKYEYDSQTDANQICAAKSSVGFKTACGKPLIISETAIKKAKMMYQSIDISESQFLQGNESTKESMTSVDMETNKSIINNYNETHRTNIKSSYPSKHEEIDTLNSEDSYTLQRFPSTAYEKTNTSTESEQTEQLELENLPEVVSGDNLSNELHKTVNVKDQSPNTVIQQDQALGKHHSIDHTTNTRISIPMTSVSSGFSTASGKVIKISDHALSNARNLLVEDENSLQSNPSIKTINKDTFARFSTGNSELEKISENVLLKTKKLLATGQENTPPPRSATKRNSNEMETPESSKASVASTPVLKSLSENILSENTPLGVSILQTSKRVRFNSELQARKLFSEKGSDTDEETEYPDQFNRYNGYKKGPRTPLNSCSNYACHLLSHERNKNTSFIRNNITGLFAKSEMFEITDRLMVPKLEAQKSWPLNQEPDTMQFAEKLNNDNMRLNQALKDRRVSAYSDEITASTEALLADEENSLDGKSWTSAITCSPILIEDRNISAKPLTLGVEIPTSPIIGAKFRSLRKNKRRKKNPINKDVTNLNEVLEEQMAAQDSQQSSGVATPSSSSSKESHRSTNALTETTLLSKLEKLEATSSMVQFCDIQFENSEEIVSSVMDDREVMDYFSENHIAATLKQEKEIRAKKKSKPKPSPGGLLLRKMANKESRVSWRQVTNGVPPRPRTASELISAGITLDVMDITAASALDYRFKCVDFYSKDEILANSYGLETGDGSRLIFNGNGYAGVAEFEQAFMASPGVDPTLVPLRWVKNHYRWIVWKLASMDRMKFGDLIMPRMLTPHNVMEQLKYRYDREIDKSQRPALRRIIEKDDPPNRRMVLCVATITKPDNIQTFNKSPGMSSMSPWKVEITDGWYSITVTIDSAMSHLIAIGKVREGTKLVTCRAELLNCEQACFPLEIPGEASLKIHTNSTRRVKWDTKLGYCRYLGPVPTSIPSILPNGGLIGKLDVIITRVYPIQYFEKTYNGQSVFRNSKCEDKAVMIYEKERQAQIDSIYSKSRAEFEAKHRNNSKKKSPTTYSKSVEYSSQSEETGEKLCRNEWNHGDLESCELENAFRIEVEAKLRQNLPPPRKVTLLLKVRVMEGDNLAIITFWSPSEDIIDVIKEGNRVSIHNVQTSGRRSGELQLATGRQSFVKPKESNVPSFPRRCLTSIPEAAVAGFNPPFGEFDTVGIVVSLGPAPHGMKNFEVVNLAYPSPDPSDSAYLSILFWEGIGAHGFSDILSIGAIVACTNLQWRRGAPRTIPMAYSTEHSTFTRNPRQVYLRSAFDLVKSQITSKDTRKSVDNEMVTNFMRVTDSSLFTQCMQPLYYDARRLCDPDRGLCHSTVKYAKSLLLGSDASPTQVLALFIMSGNVESRDCLIYYCQTFSDPVSYVSQCAVEIALEHQKKSTILRSPATQGTPSKASPSLASVQDKCSPGVSPRTPQSLVDGGEITPAKYSIQRRLEKLQWYGEPPELSPIALNHSSMKVNQKFVPPARTPENLDSVNQRRDSSLKK